MTRRSASIRHRRSGMVMVIAMIFLLVFSALTVSMATMANSNTQVAANQHKANAALLAAQSGLELGKYVIQDPCLVLPRTQINYIRPQDADTVWDTINNRLKALTLDSQTVPDPTRFNDPNDPNCGDEFTLTGLSLGQAFGTFTLRFYRYDIDPNTIKIESTGVVGPATRKIHMDMEIAKGPPKYAIASRGRMWLTGDTTVYGPVYSSWDVESISPFNMTSDSTVHGTINTVLDLDTVKRQDWQLETLDANDQPIDANRDPLGNRYEDRLYGLDDQDKAYHENHRYGQDDYTDNPGMDISDYDTSIYQTIVHYGEVAAADASGVIQNGNIPTSTISGTSAEKFPHGTTGYNSGTGLQLTRDVYENKTFRNVCLPSVYQETRTWDSRRRTWVTTITANRRAALFQNCTFEGVLYVDCAQTASSTSSKTPYNNLRFDNCTFNGVIVTNTPQTLWSNWWMQNCLYFTGPATFNNQSTIQEATILAPHFNVNLGNTNSEQDDNNILTGAIIGGIVDIRGNAQINGAVISMADTTCYESGYVTNIGATLGDGGSETTTIGDVGTITIILDTNQRPPNGVMSPIVIKPRFSTYAEGA